MIAYNLQDKDENIFALNDQAIAVLPRETLAITGEQFAIDNRTEENSFLSGNVQIGDNRLLSRILPFTFNIAYTTDADFNSLVNTFIYQLMKVDFLIDVTNEKRTKVVLSDMAVNFDTGSQKRSADVNFSLECLNSYWEDNTELTVEGVTVADVWKEIAFNNSGYIELYPTVELDASAACGYVELLLDIQSIRVEDTLFGTVNYETMEINNEDGYIKLGLTDRTTKIVSGLGFISIPAGSYTLELLTEVSCNYTIRYRRRYFV